MLWVGCNAVQPSQEASGSRQTFRSVISTKNGKTGLSGFPDSTRESKGCGCQSVKISLKKGREPVKPQFMFPACHLLTFVVLDKNGWHCPEAPGSPEPYSGNLFGAVCQNAGCNALQIPDGRFQAGQDPWEGCTVISSTSTLGGIREPVSRSGAAGRTNKALTCFSSRQLHVIQQEALCVTRPGHRHEKRALKD